MPGSGSDASNAPLGGLAVSPSIGIPAKEGSSGSALATLTPGNLNLANQAQDLAALNTDLSKANTQAEIFDIDRLKARQESAAALSELLNGLTGDISAKLGFAEGSPEKTALHAAVGAIVAKMAGGDVGSGALAGAVSEIANGIVQDLLKANPDLTDAQKASLSQWAAVAVGAAVAGQLGAATALDNVNHNYLTHEQLDRLAAELKGCASEPDSAACEQRVSQRYEELDFAQERAFEACRTMACAEEHLSQMQYDQERLYAQILAIQELGADSALGQRLLANQVDFMLDHRIVDVLAGISYCEANGGTSGCFETGQIVKFFAEGVTALAYAALGISNLNRGNGSVKPGQGEVDGGVPNASNSTPRTVGNLQGGPLEHATQVSGRFKLESGPPNGTVFRADNQGNITSYATYDANGQILTRVDVTGAAHNGVPTPHVLEYGRNTLPNGSVRVQTPRTDPRPATPAKSHDRT